MNNNKRIGVEWIVATRYERLLRCVCCLALPCYATTAIPTTTTTSKCQQTRRTVPYFPSACPTGHLHFEVRYAYVQSIQIPQQCSTWMDGWIKFNPTVAVKNNLPNDHNVITFHCRSCFAAVVVGCWYDTVPYGMYLDECNCIAME